MAQLRARIHAMKMGYEGFRHRRSECRGLADAMIMAWIAPPASTMFRPLDFKPVTSNRQRQSMKKSVIVSLVVLIAGAASAAAQSGPSPQEQMACRSDAGKFCAEHIGKPPQMNACLRENKTKLSDACRKVVEARGG